MRAGRRRVRRGRESGDRDELYERLRGPFEVVLVRPEIALELGVRDGDRIGDEVGPDREGGNRHRVVLVLVDPPQLRVGDVHVGRDVLRQLELREPLAVDHLDLGERDAVPRLQELLPLTEIELAVGLELGVAHHLGRR